MNELVKLQQNKGRTVVSARELYEALDAKLGNYSKWCEANIIKNEFAQENEDWIDLPTKEVNLSETEFLQKSKVGRPSKDYLLAIPFAKKLCMLTKTQKGEEIRNYFLDCEKNLLTSNPTYQKYPPVTVQIPEKSLRSCINQLVREYAYRKKLPYTDVWRTLYCEFKYRFHIDLDRCNGYDSPLDKCEAIEKICELYALARQLFDIFGDQVGTTQPCLNA